MVGTGKGYHHDQTNNMCRMEMNGVSMTRGEIGQLTGLFRVGSVSSTNDGLGSPAIRLAKMPRTLRKMVIPDDLRAYSHRMINECVKTRWELAEHVSNKSNSRQMAITTVMECLMHPLRTHLCRHKVLLHQPRNLANTQ